MRTAPLPAVLGAALTLVVAACGDTDAGTTASAAGSGPISVKADDTACTVSRTTVASGVLEFTITNVGSTVTEFYIYGDGDQIMGEVENVTPGLTRQFHVQLTEPGTYQTACKPGMKGDGIRAPFTVTGTTATAAPDARMGAAVTQYQQFVSTEADLLLERTATFVAAVKAGKVEEAKAAFPLARGPWERIEPVAEAFGDLDPKIDGREDVVQEGMPFTGFHRLEKDLWARGLQPDSGAIADRLLVDVKEIVRRAKSVRLNPLQLANGAKGLLDEVATGKITGEEDRYSHTDLYDFAENVKGSKAAIDALRPVLQARDPALLGRVDAAFAALEVELDHHRTGNGYRLYTQLSKAQIKALSVALDAVSEPISQVAAVVAQ
jgi:iron uptake system component EfeO